MMDNKSLLDGVKVIMEEHLFLSTLLSFEEAITLTGGLNLTVITFILA